MWKRIIVILLLLNFFFNHLYLECIAEKGHIDFTKEELISNFLSCEKLNNFEKNELKNAILAKIYTDNNDKEYHRICLEIAEKHKDYFAMKIFLCLLKNNIKISRKEANKLILIAEKERKHLRKTYGSLCDEQLAFVLYEIIAGI